MYLPLITDESNGLSLSKEGLSNPYIINVINNTSQDKVATVFSANTQLQELNNATIDGVVAFLNGTDEIVLTPIGEVNNKTSFEFNLGLNFYTIQWSPSVLNPPEFAWLLISIPTPVIQWELASDTALPISNSVNWQQVNMSSLITSINTKREVQVNSSIPGVNYEQILQQSTLEPFKVGLTQVYSSSLTQLLEPYQRVERDVNGNLTKIPFIPTVDPYQNNVSLVEFNDEYTIDGNIGLQFNILANTSTKILFFPNKVVKPQNILDGIPDVEEYKVKKDEPKPLEITEEKFSNFTSDNKTNYKGLVLTGVALFGLYLIMKKWD